jgi:hypothetical protein
VNANGAAASGQPIGIDRVNVRSRNDDPHPILHAAVAVSDATERGERTCQPWRCGESCWGLPECTHPERTPFYEIQLPTAADFARAVKRESRWRIFSTIVTWVAILLAALALWVVLVT